MAAKRSGVVVTREAIEQALARAGTINGAMLQIYGPHSDDADEQARRYATIQKVWRAVDPLPERPKPEPVECGTVAGYLDHRRRHDAVCDPCKNAARTHYLETLGGAHDREYLPCGTPAAYARHRRNGQVPCAKCKAAYSEYRKAHRVPVERSRGPKPCGTDAAYRRHKRRGEQPCSECTVARHDRQQASRDRIAARRMPCGTLAAYRRHRKLGEPQDVACRLVWAKAIADQLWADRKKGYAA